MEARVLITKAIQIQISRNVRLTSSSSKGDIHLLICKLSCIRRSLQQYNHQKEIKMVGNCNISRLIVILFCPN